MVQDLNLYHTLISHSRSGRYRKKKSTASDCVGGAGVWKRAHTELIAADNGCKNGIMCHSAPIHHRWVLTKKYQRAAETSRKSQKTDKMEPGEEINTPLHTLTPQHRRPHVQPWLRLGSKHENPDAFSHLSPPCRSYSFKQSALGKPTRGRHSGYEYQVHGHWSGIHWMACYCWLSCFTEEKSIYWWVMRWRRHLFRHC